MKMIKLGFIAAAMMNIGGVLVFSRVFTNSVINEFDPVVMSNFWFADDRHMGLGLSWGCCDYIRHQVVSRCVRYREIRLCIGLVVLVQR